MLSKSFTTITTFSKVLAAVLFITFPILGFWLGMEYQKSIKSTTTTPIQQDDQATTIEASSKRCTLIPDPGTCKAYMPSYYFDQQEKKCKQFIWGGCGGTRPFEKLAECKSVCETDTTSTWKSYRNEEYGFAFEYPSFYNSTDNTDSEGYYNNVVTLEDDHIINVKVIHDIDIYKILSAHAVLEREVLDSGITHSFEDTSIGFYNFSLATPDSKSSDNKTLLLGLIKHPVKNEFIMFSLGYSSTNTEPNNTPKARRLISSKDVIDEFYKILATFIFIEDASVPTSSFVTNKDYNFQFMLPDSDTSV